MTDLGRRERVRVTTPVGTESRTKQSFQEESDVNAIMRKYLSTGIMEHVNRAAPRYGDFTNADDYLASVEKVRSARAGFDALPAHVRDHVKNDPAELLKLVFDPERREEAAELGLVDPKQEELPLVPPDPPEPDPPPAVVSGGD